MYQQTSRPSGSQRDEGQQVKIPLGQQLFGSLFLRARMVRKKKRENDNCQHTESEHAIIFLNMFTSEYSKKFLLDCIGLQISEIKRMHLEHTPLRIFYGFLPSSIRFFFTDFLRISAGQLTDFLPIFYGFLPGSLRIFYGFVTDFCRAAYGFFTDFYGFLPGSLRIFYGFFTDFCRAAYEFVTILLSLRQHVCL